MWTTEQKLDFLMTRPWSIDVTKSEDGYFVARVKEVPDALATGADDRELARELWESLRSSLSARIEFGADLPRPHDEPLPWERGIAPPKPANHVFLVVKDRLNAELVDSAA